MKPGAIPSVLMHHPIKQLIPFLAVFILRGPPTFLMEQGTEDWSEEIAGPVIEASSSASIPFLLKEAAS